MKKLLFRLLFKLSLLNKTVIALPNEYLRGIGKTTILVKYSKKHDIPILVKYHHMKAVIKHMDKDVRVLVFGENLHGARFQDGLLIEEDINADDLDMLRRMGHKIRGGFIRI